MLSFSNATGNLFNRLGKLGALILNMRSHQLTQLTAMTNTTTGVVAQFNGESDIQALMGSAYIPILTGPESIAQTAQGIAEATVNRMVFRDNPQLAQSLQQLNVQVSLNEIIRQMKVAGASILAMTITATPGTFTGVGNGVIVASTKRPLDGLVLENSFSETLTMTCQSDSYIGNATAGNESMLVTGAGSQGDFFAFNWPLGSNASANLSVIDGNTNNGSGNILTNSGFDTWASSAPSNWEIIFGTAGVNIVEETSINYDGTASLGFVGDGSTAIQIRQKFDNSSVGTAGQLDALTQYSFNVWVRRDGTAAAAGVATIDLVDSNNVVIQDQNGVNNTFTIDLTALTTVFTAYNNVFRTPHVMPSSAYIRIRLSTPLTTGRTVYFDKASLGIMTQIYTSGPYLACHAGSTPFAIGDYSFTTITNGRGAAGTVDTFQTLLARLFPSYVIAGELLFPSSATPTISDGALII